MHKKITSALISVFYKDGLEPLVKLLHQQGVTIYSTGGTQQFLETLGIPCIGAEQITNYPSILGGRVKTLHPKIFGGILGRRDVEEDTLDMKEYQIPPIDLVIVDLYPFQETVASTNDEKKIIEKIDIGGPSMIRAAAKNFEHVCVIASKSDYSLLHTWLFDQNGETTLEQRKQLAAKAFDIVMQYDVAIYNYFNTETTILRYGENPHQKASFTGKLHTLFTQLHGKELSYNNLVDVDAAIQLGAEFKEEKDVFFSIIKHTNVCGAALRSNTHDAWKTAIASDPESAFGGILFCSSTMDATTASAIQEIFFEVLIARSFTPEAIQILQQKKNRILLQLLPNALQELADGKLQSKSLLNGQIEQEMDNGSTTFWNEEGGRTSSEDEKVDLQFANVLCKHLKSNAIAIVKNKQLIGKGCGQTSRIDALRQAIDKATQFNFDMKNAVLASDAFFPFDDCIRLAHASGISACIQPGGSIRDKDTVQFSIENNMVLVITGMRHFKH